MFSIYIADARTGKPLEGVRVLLTGPVVLTEFSGANGKATFAQLECGTYRARVTKANYQSLTLPQFEVRHATAISVSLQKEENRAAIAVDHVH